MTGVITHQADPPYPGLRHGTLAHLRCFLAEEEVEFIVILFSTVWNEVCMNKCGICRQKGKNMFNISLGKYIMCADNIFKTSLQPQKCFSKCHDVTLKVASH